MKRNKIKYDRWLRMLFLSFALLTGGGWMAWGKFTGPVMDGSQRPTITLKDVNKTITLNQGGTMLIGHNSVYQEVKTIWVRPNQKRKLSIPELTISIGDSVYQWGSVRVDERYAWFVHWYVSKGKATFSFPENLTFNGDIARGFQGGFWSDALGKNYTVRDFFVNAKDVNNNDYGWVWSARIRDNVWYDPSRKVNKINGWDGQYQRALQGGYGMDASSINFVCAETDLQNDVVIYCDVSMYMDGKWEDSNDPNIAGVYTEPTLTKRYVYKIKNVDDGNIPIEPEKYGFDYPYEEGNYTINLSMPESPDNYFWTDGEKQYQGTNFKYKAYLEGSTAPTESEWFRLSTRGDAFIPLQRTQRIAKTEHYNPDKRTIVEVWVAYAKDSINANGSITAESEKGPVAKFIFTPKKNSGFMLDNKELADNKDRWPRLDTVRYRMIGSVDFDNGEENVTELLGSNADKNARNNMANSPFGSFEENLTSYGFLRKDAYTLPQIIGTNFSTVTSYPNIYGLFRSANHTGVSENGALCYADDNWKRTYQWNPLAAGISGGGFGTTETNRSTDILNLANRFSNDLKLYDRTYEISKDSDKKHYGYFYYIDASNEPGTLVEIPVESICSNTELTVTAWLADMTRPGYMTEGDLKTRPLAPNINLLFKGKNSKGEEVTLHRFTSCDALTDYKGTNEGFSRTINVNVMQWQQLCYSFVIDDLQGCTDFFLEVQNNEPHTDGADYAIDDIRIFKRKPEVEIVQAGDLCDTSLKTVKYGTSYSNIMRVMGLAENEKVEGINKDVEWNDTLPEELKDYISKKYPGNESDAVQYFTKIYYSVYEEGNLEKPILIDYDGDGEKELCRVSYLSTRIEDMGWVDPLINDVGKNSADKIYSLPLEIGEYFDPSKKYIARISSQPIGNDGVPAKCDECALIGDPFSISVTGERFKIFEGEKLDIEISSPESAVQGKPYKIAGNFRYLDDGWKTLENAKFDWFIGDTVEFNTKTVQVSADTYTIAEALKLYSTNPDKSDNIKNALITYGEEYDKNENKNGKFVFDASSFDYEMANKYQTIIGLPQAQQKDSDGNTIDDHLYCPDPVVIQLGPNPPTIEPGDPDVPDPDPEDPDTPEDPDPKDPDDPQPDKDPEDGSPVRSVRLGLIQIQDMQKYQGTLRIPIHIRKSTDNERFVVDMDNSEIMVCETSDQKRKEDLVNKVVATLDGFGDEYVATDAKPKWDKNYFKIKFEDLVVDSEKGFREGFWYMVEIPYAVKDGNGNGAVVYRGSMKLTLKIVPEYVTWVGSETDMHNWNNDGPSHWRRSTDKELYTTEVASKNGKHTEAYTPMRFTKVTIYGKAQYKDNKYDTEGSPYASYPHLYALDEQGQLPILNMKAAKEIGAATKNIEYDLLADPDYEQELFGKVTNPDKLPTGTNHNYSCVRFYGNTCDEIYIKPESEILHTEYLTYNKAHVDYEMDPNRWYMLASPLKGVVSGDMYLPVGKSIGKYARQETPAFDDITYQDNTVYTRWNPAVYMRGWNKESVKVVYPEGKTVYGFSADWSNLYNDVDVPFTPGHGFSIGTKTSGFDGKVLFRLPKDDARHSYFSETGTSKGSKLITPENRAGNGRFIFSPDEKGELAVTTTGMFGNPFMSHLDMRKFIDRNSENNTYYILSGSTMVANIVTESYRLSTESDYDPNYVAPLQSFIKKDLDEATFTTAMIAKAPTSGKKVGLRSATAAASEKTLPQLRITASRGGVHNTALVAGLVTASDSYIEGEDAALLINEEVAAPQVYTLAGNQMTAINVTPELKDIPVGIYGKDASPVELSFKLSGDMQNVTLVDKQSGKVYPVTDGLTLTVSGNTSGRYFLNGSIATSNEVIARNEIVCYANGNGQIVVSSVDPLTRISVYSVSGQRLRYLDNLNMQTVYVKDLAPGIYIVKAESVTQVCSEKMEVK